MDKLLLIDDEDDVRYSFKRIFNSGGTGNAASGEDGLVIKSFQPDLVLMDVRMGGTPGWRHFAAFGRTTPSCRSS